MIGITVTPDPTDDNPDAVRVEIEGLERDYYWRNHWVAQNALTFQSRGARLSAQAAIEYWNNQEKGN